MDLEAIAENKDKEYMLLDYGCGVGNGFFPVIESFGMDNLKVNGCDISKTAVALIKKHDLYNEAKINAV